jgi:hypothetical protein
MNSDYRLLSTTRNIFCCGPKEEDEPDDGMTIDQLIKSLDNILIRKNYERTEIKLKAWKYAQRGDKERAISELTIYNTESTKYAQLVKVLTKARLFRDSIDSTHDLAQISNTMKYAVVTHPINDIRAEWENIVQMTIEPVHDINDNDYEELLDPDLVIEMPDVPTHVPKVKVKPKVVPKKTKIHAT